MTTVKNVEAKIRRVEGFAVRLHYGSPGPRLGRDVRSDRGRLTPYHYERAAPNEFLVSDWIAKRFEKAYPGLAVEVLDADGVVVHGRTKLRTVRATYE